MKTLFKQWDPIYGEEPDYDDNELEDGWDLDSHEDYVAS